MQNKLVASGIALLLSLAAASTSFAADPKPRIVVLTDISPITVEPDDFESTIRLFVHADLFEIEALVATTGWSNPNGGSEHPEIIRNIIDAYEKDLPNLMKRSGQSGFQADESNQVLGYWPSPAYLRERTVMGSRKMGMQFIGENNNSPGSDLIIKLADEKDDRPLYVLTWGGANTLAQAIWKVQKERTREQLKEFLHKVRIYTITDQDRPQRGTDATVSSHYWMRKEFSKDLKFIWDESAWTFQNGTGKSNWDKYAADIQGKGNLGTIYPKYKYGVEGDTPSFLYVQPNGLNDPENPTFGGWGGMFVWGTGPDKTTECFVNQSGTSINAAARKYETRFYPAIYNNFVARINWAKDGKGNRNPDVIVNGDKTLNTIKLAPATGSGVSLDAAATTDPDGDKLTFSWWVMTEAGTYAKDVALSGKDTSQATLNVPANSAGKSFHVICEVTDNGTPPLTSYRRIIIESTGPKN
jgi:hypothetical protein